MFQQPGTTSRSLSRPPLQTGHLVAPQLQVPQMGFNMQPLFGGGYPTLGSAQNSRVATPLQYAAKPSQCLSASQRSVHMVQHQQPAQLQHSGPGVPVVGQHHAAAVQQTSAASTRQPPLPPSSSQRAGSAAPIPTSAAAAASSAQPQHGMRPPSGTGTVQQRAGGSSSSTKPAGYTSSSSTPGATTSQQHQRPATAGSTIAASAASTQHYQHQQTMMHKPRTPGMASSSTIIHQSRGGGGGAPPPTSGSTKPTTGPPKVHSFTSKDASCQPRLQTLNFNQRHPPVPPPQKLTAKAKVEATIAKMKREGPLPPDKIPGGQRAAITVLDGKYVIRGPKAVLDSLRKHPVLAEMSEKDAVAWCEDGAPPSNTLIALDFDKTLVKNFLWAELGGLQGVQIQKANLANWVREGKLLGQAFGGEDRIAKLRRVIEARHARGDFVCILSSGFAQVIKIALQHVGLSDVLPQDLIFGCDTQPYGISKSSRLAKLKEKHQRAKAVLVDDDLNYCRQAVQQGHSAIWVKDGQGIEDVEMQKLLTDSFDVNF
ncbi:unnamed protein product [Amoebophrya sp. A120]|nr:unnamed protein product [Amoebophrya sp. A120]|eukprot:GSA120T00003223001.1